MQRLYRLPENQKFLLVLYIGAAMFASLQSYLAGSKTFEEHGLLYTHFNNYVIFKQSFFHLLHNLDLYQHHPIEQWDLYKYSPAFALLFGPLALLPDWAGLTIWNLANAMILFFAVYFLPRLTTRAKGFIVLFVFIELLTSMQNEQSNGLIAGLLLFAFGFLERDRYWLASLFLVATIFIKLFGIVALALYLLYQGKLRLTYTTTVWVLVFTFLPLLVISIPQLLFLYQSWGNLLANDHSLSDGLSVIGWLKTWFGWQPDKTLVSLIGVVLFCIPLLRIKNYTNYTFRILLLASILVWVVIFNHRAESPTFIIAVCGVALWYFAQPFRMENQVLLLLTFVFTILSATDIFPAFLRNQWLEPYVIKAVPCILVWLKIVQDMLVQKKPSSVLTTNQQDILPQE